MSDRFGVWRATLGLKRYGLAGWPRIVASLKSAILALKCDAVSTLAREVNNNMTFRQK